MARVRGPCRWLRPQAFQHQADDRPPAPAACPRPPGATSCAHLNPEKDARCGHPSSGQAGPRTSLLPLICASRSCPCLHPSRSTSVLGGCRHHLRCSRPRPAGLARQEALCLPADRTQQRPTPKCSATPATGARPSTRAAYARPAARTAARWRASRGRREGDHGAEKAARLPRNRRHADPPQRQAPHGPGGKPPRARTGVAIKGDSKRVTLIQNAAKARTESRPKRTRRNDDKGRRNPYRRRKGKKVRKGRSRQVPRADRNVSVVRPLAWADARPDTRRRRAPLLPPPPVRADERQARPRARTREGRAGGTRGGRRAGHMGWEGRLNAAGPATVSLWEPLPGPRMRRPRPSHRPRATRRCVSRPRSGRRRP